MTRLFLDNFLSIPITVIKIEDNIITNINKNKLNIQLTTGSKNIKKLNKCQLGYYKKIGIKPGIGLWEVPYIKKLHKHVGQVIGIDLFINIKKVDIIGFSKGKGFSGTIKRWNFKSQDKTHGNSLSHRAPGSIGQNQSPGRVFKGKKMAGRLGNSRVTIKRLSIVKIYLDKKILLVKGCIPGYNNNNIFIRCSK